MEAEASVSPIARLRGPFLVSKKKRPDVPVPPESPAHRRVEFVAPEHMEVTALRQVTNHLTRTRGRSSGRHITTCTIIKQVAKEAVVRQAFPDGAMIPEVMSGQPDVFSKGQVEGVHRGICGCDRKFKMTHYYLQTGHPHPDKLNRDIYASDCNGRAFPVFDKLYRWNNMLLSMSELLVQAGEVAAQELVNLAYKHDPDFVVYRISSHYLEALRYVSY